MRFVRGHYYASSQLVSREGQCRDFREARFVVIGGLRSFDFVGVIGYLVFLVVIRGYCFFPIRVRRVSSKGYSSAFSLFIGCERHAVAIFSRLVLGVVHGVLYVGDGRVVYFRGVPCEGALISRSYSHGYVVQERGGCGFSLVDGLCRLFTSFGSRAGSGATGVLHGHLGVVLFSISRSCRIVQFGVNFRRFQVYDSRRGFSFYGVSVLVSLCCNAYGYLNGSSMLYLHS